jgi:hypothetical protein
LGNSCISIFSNKPEAYNTAKTDFSEVKFSVLSILKRNFKSDVILNLFQGRFPKNLAEKPIHKNDIISKGVFLNIFMRLLKLGRSIRNLEKFKVDNFRKVDFGIRSAPRQSQPTADRM